MTIERQYGQIIFVCDRQTSARCEESLDTETNDWNDALKRMTGARWRASPLRPGPGWIHCCSRCTVPRG